MHKSGSASSEWEVLSYGTDSDASLVEVSRPNSDAESDSSPVMVARDMRRTASATSLTDTATGDAAMPPLHPSSSFHWQFRNRSAANQPPVGPNSQELATFHIPAPMTNPTFESNFIDPFGGGAEDAAFAPHAAAGVAVGPPVPVAVESPAALPIVGASPPRRGADFVTEAVSHVSPPQDVFVRSLTAPASIVSPSVASLTRPTPPLLPPPPAVESKAAVIRTGPPASSLVALDTPPSLSSHTASSRASKAPPRPPKDLAAALSSLKSELALSPTLEQALLADTASDTSDIELGRVHSSGSGSSFDGAGSAGTKVPTSTSALIFTAIKSHSIPDSLRAQCETERCCCCRLTWLQRVVGFILAFSVAMVLFILSFFSLGRVVLDTPLAFTGLYVGANICFVTSSCFFVGPHRSCVRLRHTPRQLLAAVYTGLLCMITWTGCASDLGWTGLLPLWFMHLAVCSWYCIEHGQMAAAATRPAFEFSAHEREPPTMRLHSSL